MRILYLHQYFVRPVDPGGTRSYEFARRLVDAGHGVDMVTTDWHWGGGSRPEDDRSVASGFVRRDIDGIRVHAMRLPYDTHLSYAARMRIFLKFARSAGRHGRDLDYDVVFATSTPLTVALPAVRLARLRRVPFVFEVRDLWPDIPIAIGAIRNRLLIAAARRLEGFAYTNASRIVVLSSAMRDVLLSKDVSPEKLVVIPNGCDLGLFDPNRPAMHLMAPRFHELDHHPLVIYAGSIGMINDLDYLVRVADEVRRLNDRIRFVVFGDGANVDAVRRSASERGLLDRTWFMRAPVSKQEMASILPMADLAVSVFADVPVMNTNSANKFFDALAAGTAVAINYGGWQAELIKRHEAGLVLPATDAGAAARILVDFLGDAPRVERAGRNARRLAESEFDRDKQAALLIRTLEAVVA